MPSSSGIDDVHAVARHDLRREMRRILELRGVGGEHDVAQQRDLGMAPGRAVDRADHRHLDFEQPHQQMPAFPMDPVDAVRRRAGREGRGAGGGARPGELGAGAGQDHDPVVAVGADIVKRLGQLAMRPETPAQRLRLRYAASSAECRRAARNGRIDTCSRNRRAWSCRLPSTMGWSAKAYPEIARTAISAIQSSDEKPACHVDPIVSTVEVVMRTARAGFRIDHRYRDALGTG